MFNLTWEQRYARADRLLVSCPELQDCKSLLCLYPTGTTAADKFQVFAATRNIPYFTSFRDGQGYDAVVGPPDLLALISHHRPERCSLVQTSGDFISPLDYESLISLAEVACSIYGVSEVGSIARLELSNGWPPLGCVGRILPDVHVRFEKNTDLAVKTLTMIDKYRNPWKHNSYFINGWFYPGDQGYMDGPDLFIKRKH